MSQPYKHFKLKGGKLFEVVYGNNVMVVNVVQSFNGWSFRTAENYGCCSSCSGLRIWKRNEKNAFLLAKKTESRKRMVGSL